MGVDSAAGVARTVVVVTRPFAIAFLAALRALVEAVRGAGEPLSVAGAGATLREATALILPALAPDTLPPPGALLAWGGFSRRAGCSTMARRASKRLRSPSACPMGRRSSISTVITRG